MLQLLSRVSGLRFSRSSAGLVRCFANEAPKPVEEDLEREKKKKICSLEISMLRQEGHKAPDLDNLKADHWDRILELPSKSARRRIYEFFWKNEMIRLHAKEKKEKQKIENEERLAREREEKAANNHIVYGLHHNTMFLRIYDTSIKKFHNRKLVTAMMFGQKLVIDCSYDEYMNKHEATNAAKQLGISFAENRFHNDPFDLHFCNFNRDSLTAKTLKRIIPTMYNDDFPMNVTSESLTEKFDKNQLVYLTPHCRNDLEFSHDDIYIIGAMVDKVSQEPLSLAKAKRQGIRMARLPLDRYLSWGGGSGKSLTINQMVSIMLDMKEHGDWEKALRFVPRRKLMDYRSNDDDTEQQEEPRSFQPRSNYREQSYSREQSYRPNYREPNQRYSSNQSNNFEQRSNNFQGRSNNFQGRQNNFQDRQNYQERPNNFQDRPNNFQDRPNNFQDRQNYQERPNNFQDRQNNFQDRQNNFQQRPRYDSRQSRDEDFNREPRRNSFDRSRSFKEQRHADQYKFDLDSWGSKTRRDKD